MDDHAITATSKGEREPDKSSEATVFSLSFIKTRLNQLAIMHFMTAVEPLKIKM